MNVGVDQAGHRPETGSVYDRVSCGFAVGTDAGDAIAFDRDCGISDRVGAGAINEGDVLNEQGRRDALLTEVLGEEVADGILEPVLGAVEEVLGVRDDLQLEVGRCFEGAEFLDRGELVLVTCGDEYRTAGLDRQFAKAEGW